MLCPARSSNLTGGNTNKLAIFSIFPILPPCFNQSPELLGHNFKNLRAELAGHPICVLSSINLKYFLFYLIR